MKNVYMNGLHDLTTHDYIEYPYACLSVYNVSCSGCYTSSCVNTFIAQSLTPRDHCLYFYFPTNRGHYCTARGLWKLHTTAIADPGLKTLCPFTDPGYVQSWTRRIRDEVSLEMHIGDLGRA